MTEQTALEVGGPPPLDASPARAAKRLRDALARELTAWGEVVRFDRSGYPLPPDVVRRVHLIAEGSRWPDFEVRPPDEPSILVRAVAASEVNARRPNREWHVQGEAWDFLIVCDAEARAAGYGGVVLIFDNRTARRLANMVEGRDYEVVTYGHSRHVAVRQGARPMAEVL